MDSRERVLRALRHSRPDRLPCGFFGTPDFMRRLRAFLGVDQDEQVLQTLGVDLRHIEPVFVGPVERSGGLQFIERPYADFWGVPRKLVQNEFGIYSEIAGHPLEYATKVEQLEAYMWPEQDWFDTSTITEQIEQSNATGRRFINYHRAGKLFEACWPLRGMERLMIDLLQATELAEAMIRRALDFYGHLAKRVIEAGNGSIDMVTIGDDVASQRGMMISPKLWRRTLKPSLREMIRVFHALGVAVMYHSCGSILPIIEDLIEVGIDILEPIQTSATGMDPAFLKEAYGSRLSFHGGVDEQEVLPHGTPEQVAAEVEQLAATLGYKGGYILMASHAFQPDIPCENVVAMYAAAVRCGQD